MTKYWNDLKKIKKEVFSRFRGGCWVTAHSRNNLLQNLIKFDEYIVYTDTDSLKLRERF